MLPWWNKLYLIFVVYFKLGLTWSTYILSSSWDRVIIKAIILLLFKVEHNSQQEYIFIEILISFNRPKRLLRRSLRGHMPQNSPKIWALVELTLKKMTYSSSRLERQVPIFYRFINQLSLKWETPNLRPRDAFYKVSNFNPPLWLILTLQNKRLRYFLHINFILLNFCTDPSWYHDNIVICLNVFDLSRNGERKFIFVSDTTLKFQP